MEKKSKKVSTVPQHKKDTVKKLAEKMKSSKTILIASTKGLPASQFQAIKTKLRGKVELSMARKTLIMRAIADSGKGTLQNLKTSIVSDFVLMFSEMDAFELAGLLTESQSPTKAKVGDICPEDINVEAGLTELVPGPAISELGAVGLKVKVENGKLAIITAATICKKGAVIDAKVSNVLGKLNILPMKVGFIPVAAYDAKSDMIYTDIKIDKKGTYDALKDAIGKAFGFAVNIGYFTQETVKFFIAKAGLEEKALSAKFGSAVEVKEEKKEEAAAPAEGAAQ